MLNPTKKIVAEYKYLLMQMALDSPTNQQAMLNTFVTSIFCLGLLASLTRICACFDQICTI
jgi:hypothetical protein